MYINFMNISLNSIKSDEEQAEVLKLALILVAARPKAQVCGSSPAEIVGSNPALGMNVVCCQLEVSATG